jgi:hypothetical protein
MRAREPEVELTFKLPLSAVEPLVGFVEQLLARTQAATAGGTQAALKGLLVNASKPHQGFLVAVARNAPEPVSYDNIKSALNVSHAMLGGIIGSLNKRLAYEYPGVERPWIRSSEGYYMTEEDAAVVVDAARDGEEAA